MTSESDDKGEDETLPNSIPPPFLKILDDATILGKDLREAVIVAFFLKKQCIGSPSTFSNDPIITDAIPFSSRRPPTQTPSPIPSSIPILIIEDPLVMTKATPIVEEPMCQPPSSFT
jgi:hypothetical protein